MCDGDQLGASRVWKAHRHHYAHLVVPLKQDFMGGCGAPPGLVLARSEYQRESLSGMPDQASGVL